MQPGATCVHQIFYANNGTVMTKETAQMVSWVSRRVQLFEMLSNGQTTQIGPSVTPLTNYNSGFRMYEVDSGVSCPTYYLLETASLRMHALDIRDPRLVHVSVLCDLLSSSIGQLAHIDGLPMSTPFRNWTGKPNLGRRTSLSTAHARLMAPASRAGAPMTP